MSTAHIPAFERLSRCRCGGGGWRATVVDSGKVLWCRQQPSVPGHVGNRGHRSGECCRLSTSDTSDTDSPVGWRRELRRCSRPSPPWNRPCFSIAEAFVICNCAHGRATGSVATRLSLCCRGLKRLQLGRGRSLASVTFVDCPDLREVDLSASLLLQSVSFQHDGHVVTVGADDDDVVASALRHSCPRLLAINLRDTVVGA